MNFKIYYFKYRENIEFFDVVIARKIVKIVENNINN